MNFFWIYQAPDKGWWSNYRWHITEPSKGLGLLKADNWKKSFFRSGWQNKILEIDGIDNAKKCLQGLRNGTITAFGGRFRGANYDKNAKLMIKQAKRSLKEAIKEHQKGENTKIKEVAIVPSSYYNWGRIISISAVVIFFIGLILYLLIKKLRKSKGIRK